MDSERLKCLNLQMKLDILVLNAPMAVSLGWDATMLKKHDQFVKDYIQMISWEERDLIAEKSWLPRCFYSLCEFYGLGKS